MENKLKTYIGVKMLCATMMTLGEYNKLQGWTIPENEDPEAEGYLVVYPDGYKSWSPKEAFEAAYLELEDPSKISQSEVVKMFDVAEVNQLDEKTTHVKCETLTGFVQQKYQLHEIVI